MEVNSNHEAWIARELDHLRADHLYRQAITHPAAGGVFTCDGRRILNFSSNDYLDLSRHPRVLAASAAALQTYGAGATASRLVSGTLPVHEELERRLAAHKGYPACLVFGSGYLANAGCVTALVEKEDLVAADRLIHASVIDAVRLSGARLLRFRHNNPDHLDELLQKAGPVRRKLVITESVFSMDGDLAPLADLAIVSRRHGAMLMVDEAHASGVMGPAGAGLVLALGLTGEVHLAMSTLSKGLGGYGGVVCSSPLMREWLVNRARSLIYTTALPPAVMGAALGALDVLDAEPGRGEELLRRAAGFAARLRAGGLDTLNSGSQIIPVVLGDSATTLDVARRLRDEGILVGAMRPPTVPPGTARLRLSVTLAHRPEDLDHAAERIRVACAAGARS